MVPMIRTIMPRKLRLLPRSRRRELKFKLRYTVRGSSTPGSELTLLGWPEAGDKNQLSLDLASCLLASLLLVYEEDPCLKVTLIFIFSRTAPTRAVEQRG